MSAVAPPRTRPWPEQRAAVAAVLDKLAEHPATQLILPCGMGKSLVALWVAEQMPAPLTVIAVPSLTLVSQTLRLWRAEARPPRRMLAVCSDRSAAAIQEDEDDIAARELSEQCEVTRSPRVVAEHLADGGAHLIVTTYHSLPVCGEGLELAGRVADLLVADEAHHCVGELGSLYAQATQPGVLPARRRLYMTATPRLTTERTDRRAGEERMVVTSMDDEATFGPVAYELSFAAAIRAGRLTEYELVTMIADSRRHAAIAELDRELAMRGISVGARALAVASTLLDAIAKFRIRRVVTFHDRIAAALAFADALPFVAERLGYPAPIAGVVSSRQPEGERDEWLTLLREGDPDLPVVLNNVRCLSEGADVPALDAVLFATPRRSVVDIVQAIGRVLRSAPGKRRGYVIVPVVLDGPLNADTEQLRSPEFTPVWEVARALRDHDERFAVALDLAAASLQEPDLSHVATVHGGPVPSGFLEAFHAALVEHSTATWLQTYGLLRRFAVEHGRPPEPHEPGDGPVHLGKWVKTQRSRRRFLSLERAEMLERIPGWTWVLTREELWEERYRQLAAYIDAHGRLPRWDERPLGAWVIKQRTLYAQGKLRADRARRLERLAGWSWPRTGEHERYLAAVRDYCLRHGAPPPLSYVEDGLELGKWCRTRRQMYARGTLSPDWIAELERIPGWRWTMKPPRIDVERVRQLVIDLASQQELAEALHTTPDKVDDRLGDLRRQGHDIPRRSDARRARVLQLADAGAPAREIAARVGLKERTVQGLIARARAEDRRRKREDLRRRRLAALRAYTARHGRVPPVSYITDDGLKLGKWCHAQRRRYASGTLAPEEIAELESIPEWRWRLRLPIDIERVRQLLYDLASDEELAEALHTTPEKVNRRLGGLRRAHSLPTRYQARTERIRQLADAGTPVREIAAQLGVTPSTVHTALRRARHARSKR